MKTIAGWVLAAGLLMAVVFGLTPRHDSVPVDGVQVFEFDEPEVAATPEVVAPPVVYSNAQVHMRFATGTGKYFTTHVAWVKLHRPASSAGDASWTLGERGPLVGRMAQPGIAIYASESKPDGELYVDAVLVTDEFKANNVLSARLPLAPALEPAMADVAATRESQPTGEFDEASRTLLDAAEVRREMRELRKQTEAAAPAQVAPTNAISNLMKLYVVEAQRQVDEIRKRRNDENDAMYFKYGYVPASRY
jgi:hypothetical protein